MQWLNGEVIVTAVGMPGSGVIHTFSVGHGVNPHEVLWSQGYVIRDYLSAELVDDDICVTVRISKRHRHTRMPFVRRGVPDLTTDRHAGEAVHPYQRVSACAVVRSGRGMLGTECSEETSVPGLWTLPGGGVEPGESPAQAVLREIMEESAQHVRLNRILELQSDHWIGRAPSGKLEDFHALRIIYSATAPEPTDPIVLDVGGTTRLARWVPLPQWRRLSWGSATRSCLERHLGDAPSQ